MDILVAQKVMGWRRIQTVPSRVDRLSGKIVAPRNIGIPEGEGRTKNLPHYSTDIAAAWLVVEKLRALHFDVSTFVEATGATCIVFAEGTEYVAWLEQACPTAPLAICRAALKALENHA